MSDALEAGERFFVNNAEVEESFGRTPRVGQVSIVPGTAFGIFMSHLDSRLIIRRLAVSSTLLEENGLLSHAHMPRRSTAYLGQRPISSTSGGTSGSYEIFDRGLLKKRDNAA